MRRSPPGKLLALALLAGLGGRALAGEGRRWDMIVVGGGPGGASTALETVRQARAAGLPDPHVLVLESRGPIANRVPCIGLHCKTLESLAGAGVDWDVADLAWVRGEQSEHHDGTRSERRFRRRSTIRPSGPVHTVADLARQDRAATTTIPIGNVEQAIRDAAVSTGLVEFAYYTRVTNKSQVARGPEGWSVTARRRNGRMVEYRGRYLVAADGSRSILRDKLGVGVTVDAPYRDLESRYVIGVYDVPGDGWARLKYLPAVQVETSKIFRMSAKRSTAVAIEVPPERRFSGPREVFDWWRQRSELVGMGKGQSLKLRPRVFEIALRRATHAIRHASAFLVGDAVRTGHPAAEAFLQAATRDGARVGMAYVKLEQAATAADRTRAAAWYSRGTSRATTALHKKAAARFPKPTVGERGR